MINDIDNLEKKAKRLSKGLQKDLVKAAYYYKKISQMKYVEHHYEGLMGYINKSLELYLRLAGRESSDKNPILNICKMIQMGIEIIPQIINQIQESHSPSHSELEKNEIIEITRFLELYRRWIQILFVDSKSAAFLQKIVEAILKRGEILLLNYAYYLLELIITYHPIFPAKTLELPKKSDALSLVSEALASYKRCISQKITPSKSTHQKVENSLPSDFVDNSILFWKSELDLKFDNLKDFFSQHSLCEILISNYYDIKGIRPYLNEDLMECITPLFKRFHAALELRNFPEIPTWEELSTLVKKEQKICRAIKENQMELSFSIIDEFLSLLNNFGLDTLHKKTGKRTPKLKQAILANYLKHQETISLDILANLFHIDVMHLISLVNPSSNSGTSKSKNFKKSAFPSRLILKSMSDFEKYGFFQLKKEKSVSAKFCPFCGKQVDYQSHSCDYCGNSFDDYRPSEN